VAGLTAALALQRDGHEVRVYEQAPELRTGGFGLNLWSNAGSPLAALGVDIPGEPYDHIVFRAGDRQRTTMQLPTRGLPNMNVERYALIRAIHAALVPGTVQFDTPVQAAADLIDAGADLVVAADGVGSRVRPDAERTQRISKPWSVWQAIIPTDGSLLPVGSGVVVMGSTRFYGLWRQPDNEVCWFVEDPTAPAGITAREMLTRIQADGDSLVRALAAITPVERFGEWLARDRRPTRGIIGDRTVAVGDAAHPMLPCIGQGACTSIEDGIELALALRNRSVDDGLATYRRRRLPIVTTRVGTAHFACTTRRPNPISALVSSTPLGIPFAKGAGAWMRVINQPNRRVMRELTSGAGRQRAAG
jgi:2-polyprenyl-6-methoxyphenol hydroxylase-like FAD-dependent oxidoreductase